MRYRNRGCPHFWLNALPMWRAASIWALGFVLCQGKSFPMADPHTSTFSTATYSRAVRHLFRKSLQFRAIAVARQVLTPSMPRNLCRVFFDGNFCSAICRTSTTFRRSSGEWRHRKYFFDAVVFLCFLTGLLKSGLLRTSHFGSSHSPRALSLSPAILTVCPEAMILF